MGNKVDDVERCLQFFQGRDDFKLSEDEKCGFKKLFSETVNHTTTNVKVSFLSLWFGF